MRLNIVRENGRISGSGGGQSKQHWNASVVSNSIVLHLIVKQGLNIFSGSKTNWQFMVYWKAQARKLIVEIYCCHVSVRKLIK